METSDTVVLIDGDIIVYRVGFSCNSGEEWSIAKSRVDRTLQDIIENTDSCMGFGYLTDGKDNFRNKVAKTAPYKGNRIANKPPFYDEIRKYLEEYHGFKMEYTQEADDAIGIQHAELTQWNIKEPIVIASIDKDLLMIPGMHYNIAKKEMSKVSIQQAHTNFWMQVLTGDRTDNIIGLRGIGPVKAAKILERVHACRMQFIEVDNAYSDHNNESLYENMELLWIRRESTHQPIFGGAYVCNVYDKYKE